MLKQRTSRRRRRARVTAVCLLTLGLGATTALAAPGDLDTSFDGDGIRTIDFLAGETAATILAQPDGKIVLAGWSGNTLTDNFVVTRLNPDGSSDASFSGDGAASADFGATDRINGAALQADGKIVVAGVTEVSGVPADVAVARFNTNGTLDSSFDGDGMATIDYLGGVDAAEAVVVQPDGKIVLAGYGSGNRCFMLTRLEANGSTDPSFQGDDMIDRGSFCVRVGTVLDAARGAALQADGKIVVAGTSFADGSNENLAITRIEPETGLPDRTFDGDGVRTIDLGGGDSVHSVLVQPNGKIVLAGSGTAAENFVVTRLNADGSTDASFGGDGTFDIDFGGADYGYGAALQASGKIVVAGTSSAFSSGQSEAAVARLQPGGSLDTTFSGDGRQTFTQGAGLTGAALQANGRIVVAGGIGGDMLAARLDGDSAAAGGGPAPISGSPGSRGGGGPGGPGGGPGGQSGGQGVPRCNGKRATIVGSTKRDRLRGTRRADVIVALGGNDKIAGGNGNDTICAGTGNDSIDGGSGNDRLYGQDGKDKLGGGSGKDNLSGGNGIDNLSGGGGKDSLLGGGGRDKLDGGAGRDKQRQ